MASQQEEEGEWSSSRKKRHIETSPAFPEESNNKGCIGALPSDATGSDSKAKIVSSIERTTWLLVSRPLRSLLTKNSRL